MNTPSTTSNAPSTASDCRSTAILAGVLAFFAPLIGPAILYTVSKDRLVRAHTAFSLNLSLSVGAFLMLQGAVFLVGFVTDLGPASLFATLASILLFFACLAYAALAAVAQIVAVAHATSGLEPSFGPRIRFLKER